MDIEETCYELYKANWMLDRIKKGEISVADFLEDYLADGAGDSIADCLEEQGFHGELYACFDEFLDAEYQMKDFIIYLLGDNEDLIEDYLDDLDENFHDMNDEDEDDEDEDYGDDDYSDQN